MMMVNGCLVPVLGQANSLKDQEQNNLGRRNLLQELKNKTAKQQSAEVDLAQLKNSFVVRDLNSKKKEDDDKVVVEDALAYDIEKGKDPNREDVDDVLDDDDDEEYDPNEVNQQEQYQNNGELGN